MQNLIEELSLNAWPALQTVLVDGWVLRFAKGYTKRANSINPLYPSTLSLDVKIKTCEELYHKQNLPLVFKITSKSTPANLDDHLERSGYQLLSPTSVQILRLEKMNSDHNPVVVASNSSTEEWIDQYSRMSYLHSNQIETLTLILQNIVPEHRLFTLLEEGTTVACGLAVVQAGFVGLFDVVTDPNFRRCGYGARLVDQMLLWGKQQNAKMAYLQVILDNSPAINLYQKIGFVEEYQYWYRSL
jgi:ribosomal protein S18 acetylase RimI-like enzyme